MITTASRNFYKNIPGYRDFTGITDEENYRPVPEDWWICLTDVSNSTQAIADGRYRDINKVGAATITTVLNILDTDEIPFTFGGDGASVLIPEGSLEEVRKGLSGLRTLAREQFGLDLRAGVVSVQEIYRDGYDLEVGKLRLNENQSIATFRGEGLNRAEQKIKESREDYSVTVDPDQSFSLENLSCRWKPIPSERGTILTVLVQGRSANPDQTYRTVIRDLDDILEGGLDNSNPVNRPGMAYRSVGESLRDEIRYHSSPWSVSFLLRFLEILLAVSIFRLGLNPGILDEDEYLEETREQSDYRKFDGMLRFVVDCGHDERDRILSYLESRKEKGDVYFGIHESENSLMTCYVRDLNEGDHMHFIDGSGGGYASAAQQLKTQADQG